MKGLGHVPDEALEDARVLADGLGVPVEESRQLVRVLEDLTAMRRFEELRERGETKTHAIRRTAGELGFPESTIRYRIQVVRERRA